MLLERMRGAFGDDAGVVLSRRLISNNSCVVSKCTPEKMSCFWTGSVIVIGLYGAGCTCRRAVVCVWVCACVWGVLHVGGPGVHALHSSGIVSTACSIITSLWNTHQAKVY